jgi:dihydrofolate reductase
MEQGKEVRFGGGATTVRQYLDADLVETLHVGVFQVDLGAGPIAAGTPAPRA